MKPSFYLCKIKPGSLETEPFPIQTCSEHPDDAFILPLGIMDEIVMACGACRKIWLLRVGNENRMTVLCNECYTIGPMCLSRQGSILLGCTENDHFSILELDSFFITRNEIKTNLEIAYSMLVIGDTLVMSNPTQSLLGAISLTTNEKVWEISGIVAGHRIAPHGMTVTSSVPRTLIVADGWNRRVLLFTELGEHLKTISLDTLGSVLEVQVCNNELLILHSNDDKTFVSIGDIDI